MNRKDYDGLFRALRSREEKSLDDKYEDHLNFSCDEMCPFCSEVENMAKYWTKQE